MNRFKVIPFTIEHLDDVVATENLSFSIPWSRESFINEITNNPLARYVVSICNDSAIGYGGMWLVAGEGHITNIAVHPEFRGMGAAESILNGLLEICNKESISDITLEVRESNTAALNLYSKFGFIKEGVRPGYYEDNKEDAIIMWLHKK